MTIEVRTGRRPEQVAEVRASDKGNTFVGYAAVFNSYSQNLGGFVEEIHPDAFTRVLNDTGREVMALSNHDPNLVLGSRSAGTLTLSVDDIGLRYEIQAPSTTVAADLAVLIGRRDVTGSSFSFTIAPGGDEWGQTPDGFPLRTVRSVANLYDVGPVTMPAYLGTKGADASVALRSLAETVNRPLDEVVAAALADDLRSIITPPPAADDSDAPQPGAWEVQLRLKRLDLEARMNALPTR